MRIVVAHNAYLLPGGEDSVVASEIELLRSHGHDVEMYSRSNDELKDMTVLAMARQTLWSSHTERDFAALVGRFRPDVIHAHNTFPLISPSLYWAAARAEVPVVQTLHNFRFMCINGLLLRNDKVCEDCVGRLPWRGVARACYRGSHSASAAVAGMLTLHRRLGTYHSKVSRYIALNEFCRRKFVAAGLPAKRIVVKPNFVPWEFGSAGESVSYKRGQPLLFVGRLSTEKGIGTLVEAVRLVPDAYLRVVGEGPERSKFGDVANVSMLGRVSARVVQEEMCRAMALVVPSLWYENFPRTVVEAFSCGLPVIASRLGALEEIVREGVTGLLFEPGNGADLAKKMAWAKAHPEQMDEMGHNAQAQYVAEFSPDVNYRRLMEIYGEVLTERAARPRNGTERSVTPAIH